MASTVSPAQQLVRGTPVLPGPGPVQQLVRETPINPNAGPAQQLIRGAPFPDLGIRGPQIEEADLELDRLTNATGATLATVGGINLTLTATIPLFTATQKTHVFGVLLRATTANTVTVFPTVSIGVNPSTNNVFADTTLSEFSQVDDLYTFWQNLNTGTILYGSDQLDLTINTAATANSLVATAYVIGIQV